MVRQEGIGDTLAIYHVVGMPQAAWWERRADLRSGRPARPSPPRKPETRGDNQRGRGAEAAERQAAERNTNPNPNPNPNPNQVSPLLVVRQEGIGDTLAIYHVDGTPQAARWQL